MTQELQRFSFKLQSHQQALKFIAVAWHDPAARGCGSACRVACQPPNPRSMVRRRVQRSATRRTCGNAGRSSWLGTGKLGRSWCVSSLSYAVAGRGVPSGVSSHPLRNRGSHVSLGTAGGRLVRNLASHDPPPPALRATPPTSQGRTKSKSSKPAVPLARASSRALEL